MVWMKLNFLEYKNVQLRKCSDKYYATLLSYFTNKGTFVCLSHFRANVFTSMKKMSLPKVVCGTNIREKPALWHTNVNEAKISMPLQQKAINNIHNLRKPWTIWHVWLTVSCLIDRRGYYTVDKINHSKRHVLYIALYSWKRTTDISIF